MSRTTYDQVLHAHFVTFSCFRRRRLLDDDRAKSIVVQVLGSQLERQEATCRGFVVMPDHVHAVLWFPQPDQLSFFMKQWKQRSSYHIKQFLRKILPSYAATFDMRERVWQPRYYDFSIYSEKKLSEKLAYMHENPVRAGWVTHPCDWMFSSARFYEQDKDVGVPITPQI